MTAASDAYAELTSGLGITSRPSQLKIIEELDGLTSSESLAVDAPTGSGKSMAALLAGVLRARRGKRTIIGTSTVILGDQYKGEIARINTVFPEVDIFVLKGASHFYCPTRAAENLKRYSAAVQREMMKDRLARLSEGVPTWAQANSEECRESCRKRDESGRDLGARSSCDYEIARDQAVAADVVVTTHAMVAADTRLFPMIDKHLLGDHSLVVVDEAHKARGSFVHEGSLSWSNIGSVIELMREKMVGSFTQYSDITNFFDDLKRDREKHRWGSLISTSEAERILKFWLDPAQIKEMRSAASEEKHKVRSGVKTIALARDALQEIVDSSGFYPKRGPVAVWIQGSALRVGEMEPSPRLIATLDEVAVGWISATIGTPTKPTYVTDSLGASTTGMLSLPTPFDWSSQLAINVVAGQWDGDPRVISEWIGTSDGGACVLTSGHRMKDRVADHVYDALSGFGVHVLTQAHPTDPHRHARDKATLAEFKDAEFPYVLVGTDKFGTGVDVPGRALTTLVICGVPDIRVDMPYRAWKNGWLQSRGLDCEKEYQVPERAMLLEQQIGRAIRSTDDVATVLILDPEYSKQTRAVIEEALLRFPGYVPVDTVAKATAFVSWAGR